MPRLKRRSLSLSNLTTDQRDALLDVGMIGLLVWADPRYAFDDAEHMRRCWQLNRDALLVLWIQQHPGTRPRIWWAVDSPEPRQRTDGGVHPFNEPEYKGSTATHYGYPRYTDAHCPAHSAYESDRQYLERLDLLLPGEVER